MEFLEWNVICRVCLQEGEMRSIYERDEKNVTICEKIIKCSNITIKRGMNLPEQICNKCLEDLHVAYKFRTNCESSDAILQSFIEGQAITDLIMSSETGEVYKYKPPQGLNVKRIRPVPIKCELPNDEDNSFIRSPQFNTQIHVQSPTAVQMHDQNEIEEQSVIEDHHFENDDVDDDNFGGGIKEEEDNDTLPISMQHSSEPQDEPAHESKFNADVFFRSHHDLQMENQFEISENGKICTIKPVKTNKARSKSTTGKEKLRVVSATEISTKPDGTTVIRVRRNVEEPKPLKICEICGNTYKYKHALESHMRRHRNEKPFSCEICSRSFVINFELRRHMRTHTGQKPYACRFCGRRFSDFGSRIKHERTHTGERPYTCETCGKSFAYSHVLSSHILTHTGEKRFGCAECGKRFAKSHHLKAHMNTHMKNKPVLIKTNPTTTATNEVPPNKPALYQQDEKVYEEVMTHMNTHMKDKPILIKTNPTTNIPNEEPPNKPALYQTDEKVYQEVMTVFTEQPKIESYVEDEDIKVMYSNAETQHAISTINMNS